MRIWFLSVLFVVLASPLKAQLAQELFADRSTNPVQGIEISMESDQLDLAPCSLSHCVAAERTAYDVGRNVHVQVEVVNAMIAKLGGMGDLHQQVMHHLRHGGEAVQRGNSIHVTLTFPDGSLIVVHFGLSNAGLGEVTAMRDPRGVPVMTPLSAYTFHGTHQFEHPFQTEHFIAHAERMGIVVHGEATPASQVTCSWRNPGLSCRRDHAR